jgi:hypothetical protein
MIRYTLKCDRDHGFESWFANAAAYDALAGAGQVECPLCGSRKVDKALMAPAVATAAPRAPEAKAPEEALAERLAAWRKHVEENSDYVGVEFAREARAIHDGTAPDRPIWGEARPDEARALIEEGLPVAPLPFVPRTRTN